MIGSPVSPCRRTLKFGKSSTGSAERKSLSSSRAGLKLVPIRGSHPHSSPNCSIGPYQHARNELVGSFVQCSITFSIHGTVESRRVGWRVHGIGDSGGGPMSSTAYPRGTGLDLFWSVAAGSRSDTGCRDPSQPYSVQ